MAYVTYTAKNSLKSGVTAGTSVTYNFDCQDINRKTKVYRSDKASQSGKREYLKTRTDVIYQITTLPVLEADFLNFRQFLDSVDGGESFTFDPYGTSGSPISPMVMSLESDGYDESRVSVRYISTSFSTLVISATSAQTGRSMVAGWDVQ